MTRAYVDLKEMGPIQKEPGPGNVVNYVPFTMIPFPFGFQSHDRTPVQLFCSAWLTKIAYSIV